MPRDLVAAVSGGEDLVAVVFGRGGFGMRRGGFPLLGMGMGMGMGPYFPACWGWLGYLLGSGHEPAAKIHRSFR